MPPAAANQIACNLKSRIFFRQAVNVAVSRPFDIDLTTGRFQMQSTSAVDEHHAAFILTRRRFSPALQHPS